MGTVTSAEDYFEGLYNNFSLANCLAGYVYHVLGVLERLTCKKELRTPKVHGKVVVARAWSKFLRYLRVILPISGSISFSLFTFATADGSPALLR